jgi:hypothetical protein
MRKGIEKINSPLPAKQLPPPEPIPKPPDPPKPLDAKPVNAPMPTKPADVENKDGLMAKVPQTAPSQGPGSAGGVGSGQGTGLGPGDGNGVGDGSVGGYGGGPFRPGSGVEPPRLLREVKPITPTTRRQHRGEVDLIVVRRDGTVGDIEGPSRLRDGGERSRGGSWEAVAFCARRMKRSRGRRGGSWWVPAGRSWVLVLLIWTSSC